VALIQSPNIGRKLMRSLRLTAQPDVVLAPETVGVILLEDLSAPLSDIERGCMGSEFQAAVAAEFGIVVLTRAGAPATYDAIVTAVTLMSTANDVLEISVPTAGVVGLTTSANTIFTDLELPGRPTSPLGTDTQVAVPARRILMRVQVLALTFVRIPLNIRLGTIGVGSELPALMINATTVNQSIRAGFEWTEGSPQG